MTPNRILIVEDDPAFAAVVQQYVQRLGYESLGIVDNGKDAFAAVARQSPDLVLMDVEIRGGMDGFEVAEELRARHDLPVIFLTGRGDQVTLEQVRRSESFGYLLKPFRPEELKAGIELALIRHGHEAHLKQIERSFTAAIKSAGDAIVLTNPSGQITFMNPAAERLTGWSARSAVGEPLAGVFQLQGGETAVNRLLSGVARGPFVEEAVLRTRAGRELPVEMNVSAVQAPPHDSHGVVLVFRNIIERKRFEAKLQKSQDELRRLAGHLEAAREAERTRIAREIHDEFGQMLTGFKYDLAWLEKKLSATPETKREILRERVRAMMGLLHDMVQSVRRLVAELRPGVLDNLGLAAAVEWETNEFAARTGIQAHVAVARVAETLPREMATALFRILQESLTNVARHAQARSVRVQLQQRESQVVLEVSDDGRGMSEAEQAKADTFGLLGIRERLLPLRGRCEIRSQPGRGTTIWIGVPLGDPPTSGSQHD